MDSRRRINRLRKRIMKLLTGGIGDKESYNLKRPVCREEIKRVLITRPNHRLGNQLLITPLVQEISATFPGCTIDLFVKGGAAAIIFRNYEQISRIIELPKKHFSHPVSYLRGWLRLRKERYDIVFNAAKNSSSGRLSAKFARARFRFYGDRINDYGRQFADYSHLAKYPVYDFRNYMTLIGLNSDVRPVPSMDIRLTQEELAAGRKIAGELLHNATGRIISIFTWATGPKCYSADWWDEFYSVLKTKYSDYNIIEILPVENISMISFKAPSFYSRDVREICSVVACADIFIGADSGIMHLASASGTPTLGLFSMTDPGNYAPYNPGSRGLDTNTLTMEDLIHEIDNVLIS